MFAGSKIWSLLLVLLLAHCQTIAAQTRDETSKATEKATAEKFYQLFLQRPQTGTALDKTVEYYQSLGQLDALIEGIKSKANELQSEQPEAAARHWLAAALVAQSQSRWLESIELLKHASDEKQLQWEVGRTRSVAFEQLQQWPATIDALHPLVAQALQQSGLASSESVIETAQRLAKAYARNGQTTDALQTWQALEKRFGSDQQIAMRLANMAASEGELDFAIEVLDRLLVRMPRSIKRTELAVQRTSLIARQGDDDEALANYQVLLDELNSDSWLANDITRRIEDLIIAKDGDQALIAYYRTQAARRPGDMRVLLRLATLLDSEKQWEESGKLFQRLIERTATSIEPRRAYAQSLINQERWHAAAAELSKVAELAPRDEDVITQWCEAILADTEVELPAREAQVQKILEQSMATATASAATYQQLATRLQRFGQSERALMWLSKAYSLQPNDFGVVMDYVRGLLNLRQEKEALKLLTDFQEAHQQNKDELAQLADFYHEIGQKELGINCLSKACQSGATTAMRFRLAEWLESANRGQEAIAQLELAWSELPTQTKVVSEQETLCQEITRRHVELATRIGKLSESMERIRAALPPNATQPSLVGLESETLFGWRLASFLVAEGKLDQATPYVSAGLKQCPKSTMLWRLQAEIDSRAKRLPQAIAAHRKLAELDVRRRSEYLMLAAKDLARMGNLPEALKLTESITTETASSQHVIEVFDLASEHGANKFAIDLLTRRLQSRPADSDVLSRLIKFHVGQGAFHKAADYQWQSLQASRTPEQRESIVEMLIETHHQLRSLGDLEAKLDKFWRQRDLWREFGVWQTLIALRNEDYARAERIVGKLLQFEATRRFAIEQSLKLARLQSQAEKQFQLLRQLSLIDPSAVTTDALSKVLEAIPEKERSRAMAVDVVNMVRGPSNRLGLLQDLLLAAQVDWVLRLFEVLPEQEQQSWPVIFRTALASAAYPSQEQPLPSHVAHAHTQLELFSEQSLELPDTLVGKPLLEELLGSQELIVEFLTAATVNRDYSSKVSSFSTECMNCSSRLHAYHAVIAAQLQLAATSEQRRRVVESHRQTALKQADLRERTMRLSSLAIISAWQSRAATVQDVTRSMQLAKRSDTDSADFLVQLRLRLKCMSKSRLPNPTSSITTRLDACSEALQLVIGELDELANRGDSLATLLCMQEMTMHLDDVVKRERSAKKLADNFKNLGEYEAFAPSELLTVMAIAGLNDKVENPAKYLQSLSRMTLSRTERQHLLKLVLAQDDATTIELVVKSLLAQSADISIGDLLGELLCNRTGEAAVDGWKVLRALDSVWKSEVEQGLRSHQRSEPSKSGSSLRWAQTLPLCSLTMHESCLFKRIDFDVLRAILAQSSSNASRKEILQLLKQLADEPAGDELRMIRQLARVFVFELLEQDTQSAKLLDEILPESISKSTEQAMLRGLWLDLIGRHDAAIAWLVQLDNLPGEIREQSAAALLRMSIEQHDDAAIDTAVDQLHAVTTNLIEYRDAVRTLISRNKLAQAEKLVGEFEVVLPPTDDLLSPVVSINQTPSKALALSLGSDPAMLARWQQTGHLFALLRKYAKVPDKAAAFRVASKLIEGVNHASDKEIRDHLMHFVTHLEISFDNPEMLSEFLQLESARVGKPNQQRETLCILTLIARAKLANLAEPIVTRMLQGQMSALEYLQVAQCEMQLGQSEAAALLFARAFDLQPEWLESSIASLRESPRTIALLIREMNKKTNCGAGVGSASMELFLKTLPNSQIPSYANLWLGWAGNDRPKSQVHLRIALTSTRDANFDLWLNLVERLLVSEELTPMVLVFDSSAHWARRLNQPGTLEQHFWEIGFDADRHAKYQAMLEKHVDNSRVQFVARLLLIHSLLSNSKLDQAAEQLEQLLLNVKATTPVKNSAIAEWNADILKLQANPRVPSLPQRPALTSIVASEIDRSAKVKLLLRLLEKWESSEAQVENRFRLLQGIGSLGGLDSLSVVQQTDLLRYYAETRDDTKVLSLFESDIGKIMPANGRQSQASNPSPLISDALNLLATRDMNWVRHMVLVRAAQVEQVPLEQSSFYLRQLYSDTSARTPNPQALTYPLTSPADQLLDQYISQSRQQLPGVWANVFKPHVILNFQNQTIQIVSMLDAIWPIGTAIVDDATRQRVRASVQDWSKDLASIGPWQVLALHNLAARLGEAALVKQTQERLLELDRLSAKKNDPTWQIACWSAVIASSSIPEVDSLRFQLGELARAAAADSRMQKESLFVRMTAEQLDKCFTDSGKPMQLEKMFDDVTSVASRVRGALRAPGELGAYFKINMLMFEKRLERGDIDSAIELLRVMRSSQLIQGTSYGIVAADELNPSPNDVQQAAKTLALFQRLIDNHEQTEKLQRLWELLLLEPIAPNQNAVSGMGNAPSAIRSPSEDGKKSPPPLWRGDWDADQPPSEVVIPNNMYRQLVQLARINGTLPELEKTLANLPKTVVAKYMCGALLALEQQNVPAALKLYQEAAVARQKFYVNDMDLDLVRDSIFNVVRKDPLSQLAVEYSFNALQRPLNTATVDFVRQQFVLSARQKDLKVVDQILVALGRASHLPQDVRSGLLIEYATALLDGDQVKASLDAYLRAQVGLDKKGSEPDLYMLKLMARLPTLTASDQAELFDCFVSGKYARFPWLICYQVPVKHALPRRFRSEPARASLVYQSLDSQRTWVSCLSWIADYAERTKQALAAMDAAALASVDHPLTGWGAAALTVRLNPQLTAAALKSRLAIVSEYGSPASMRALLDCCHGNESLRSVAVESILNLGFPEIALAPTANAPATTGWKHWLILQEATLSRSDAELPKWSLSKSGQWTAQSSKDTWYLMLRYPIEGDFELSVTAHQASGNKFGIGCDGLAAVQHDSDPAIKCLGVGQRLAANLLPAPTATQTEVALKVRRHGPMRALQVEAANIEEQSDETTSLVYLLNQGTGVAHMDAWRLSGDLKIARSMNLVDPQMRLWRTTLGSWKLPSLKVRIPGNDSHRPTDCYVADGVLHLTTHGNATNGNATNGNNVGEANKAVHCLRPLQVGESVSYEFYHAADSASVHPALGRMVFRLDEEQLQLQWLTHAEECRWLGIANANRFPIEASEKINALQLQTGVWNKVRLTLTEDKQVAVELNGQPVARIALPPDLVPEFGITVTNGLPAKVRNIRLSGPWPQTLTIEQLQDSF